jgi:hypothetical protein
VPVLLLWAPVRIVINLSTVITSIGVVAWSATLDWGIVRHSLTWGPIARELIMKMRTHSYLNVKVATDGSSSSHVFALM